MAQLGSALVWGTRGRKFKSCQPDTKGPGGSLRRGFFVLGRRSRPGTEKVSLAYTIDSVWRNRDTFLEGRDAIVEFLTEKWSKETQYALRKDLWTFAGNRIAVRFQYESRDLDGRWWRSYGNEHWEFADNGLMRRREASINDVEIDESDRRIFGPRDADDSTGIPVR